MEGLTREKQVHMARLVELSQEMPFFIQEFVEDKLINQSPSTLLAYVREYHHFFNWAKAEGLIQSDMKQIPLSFCEKLPKKDVENYIRYLRRHTSNQLQAINRKLSALKSLFTYLTTQTENEEGECYFYRNVMAKIDLLAPKESESRREGNLADKVLHNGNDRKLLSYVEHEYQFDIEGTNKLSYFKRDKERDLALIALLISSGIRVGEATNLKLDDLDMENKIMKVIRKGNKKDSIPFQDFAGYYLQSYLQIRKQRYQAANQGALFVTLHKNTCRPISVRAIQNLLEKYTTFLKKRVSPHQLRHTFATKLAESGTPLHVIQHQLGHSNPKTTSIYMNSTLKEMKKYIT